MKEKSPYRSTHIDHHDDGSHTVRHEHHAKATKSPAFMERQDADSYSAEDGPSLMSKLEDKLKIKRNGTGGGGHDEKPAAIEREDGDDEE